MGHQSVNKLKFTAYTSRMRVEHGESRICEEVARPVYTYTHACHQAHARRGSCGIQATGGIENPKL